MFPFYFLWFLAGDVLYQVKHQICMWKKHFIYGLYNQNRSLKNNLKALKSYSSQKKRGSICCLSSPENNNFLLSGKELLGGKVIYTVAPAMGHNKVQTTLCSLYFVLFPIPKSLLSSIISRLHIVYISKSFYDALFRI